MGERLRLAAICVLAVLVFLPATAWSQDLEWDFDRRVGWPEAVVTSSTGVALGVLYLGLDEPHEPRWIGPVLLDDYARDGLVATGPGVDTAAGASDLLVTALMGYTIFVDSIGRAGLANDEWDSAFQTSAIAVQSHALNVLVTTGLKYGFGRRRPGFGRCYDEPFSDASCAERPNVSFPSGHTSAAFTGAGLVCVTHEHLPYYGGGVADRIACYTAIGLATATGILRIASNNHYLTDIAAGALLGFAMGYVIPKVVYFGGDAAEPERAGGALRPPEPPIIRFGGSF